MNAWFSNAKHLKARDIECGVVKPNTMHSVQILWAATSQVGCAYGILRNGNERVVCNFAPGASYFLYTDFFCGISMHQDLNDQFPDKTVQDDDEYLMDTWGIYVKEKESLLNASHQDLMLNNSTFYPSEYSFGVESLKNSYFTGWGRSDTTRFGNGTAAFTATLVARYTFTMGTDLAPDLTLCDSNEPVYRPGPPASACIDVSHRYEGLCYAYRDPVPGYRVVACIAPAFLFSLILYDLFSSVMREAVY